MGILSTARRYLADIGRAFDRAPVEVAISFAAAVAISYSIETKLDGEIVFRVIVSALLVALTAWAATLLHAMSRLTDRQRWILTFVGAACGALYLLAAGDLDAQSETWRALMLVGGVALLVVAAPALGATEVSSLRLRRINSRVLVRAIGIILYGLALFAGLALAITAVNNLFELKLHDNLYGHVFTWIMFVLVPCVIVGGIDDYVRPLDEQDDVARSVHRLTTFLVPPLVALYYLILCAYVIRIIITHELPKNLVSPMVIAAGLLAFLALILFDPAPSASSGMRWLRYTPVVFLPLGPLGLWALAARISQYGWTEFRLLRVVLLIGLLALALLFVLSLLRRRDYPLRTIPLWLGVVLLLFAVGPWSVLAIARRDQQHRLATALRQAHVEAMRLPAATDTVPRLIDADLFARINGTASYLRSHFGEASLASVVPPQARGQRTVYALAEFYHLRAATADSVTRTFGARLTTGSEVKIPGVGTAYRVELPSGKQQSWAGGMSGDTVFIRIGQRTLLGSLAPLLEINAPDPRNGQLPPLSAVLLLSDGTGRAAGELVVLEVSIQDVKGKRSITHLDGLLTVRQD